MAADPRFTHLANLIDHKVHNIAIHLTFALLEPLAASDEEPDLGDNKYLFKNKQLLIGYSVQYPI